MAAVFFPFRTTYVIEYFQHAKGLTLQQAGVANSWVFFAAIFATPFFGLLADRIGHRALMLTFGTLLLSQFLGPKLWTVAKQHSLATLPDFLEFRYGKTVKAMISILFWCGALAR